MIMRHVSMSAAAICCLSGAGLAANTSLQLDLRALAAQSFDSSGSPGPFIGLNHTGSLGLSADTASSLSAIRINGTPQTLASGQLNAVSGSIDLGNGTVLGGSISVALNNGDTFTAQIASGVGGVSAQPGQGFSINGAYFNALFSGSTFGGINISQYFNAQPLSGTYLLFELNPVLVFNGEGIDEAVDLTISLVPSPGAAAPLAVGVLGFASRRRRG